MAGKRRRGRCSHPPPVRLSSPRAEYTDPVARGHSFAVVAGHEFVQDRGQPVQAVPVSPGQLRAMRPPAGEVRYSLDQACRFARPTRPARLCGPRGRQQARSPHFGRRIPGIPLDRHQQLVLHRGLADGVCVVPTPALELPHDNMEFSSFTKSHRLSRVIVNVRLASDSQTQRISEANHGVAAHYIVSRWRRRHYTDYMQPAQAGTAAAFQR